MDFWQPAKLHAVLRGLTQNETYFITVSFDNSFCRPRYVNNQQHSKSSPENGLLATLKTTRIF